MGSATVSSFNTPTGMADLYGTVAKKNIADMSDQEFADYKALSQRNKDRTNSLNSYGTAGTFSTSLLGSGNSGSSNSATNSSGTNTSTSVSLQQQAKDMAQTQLENSDKQMAMSAKYRSAEAEQNNQITQSQSNQTYGFQRGLSDQQQGFRTTNANQDDEITRRQNEQKYGFERGINDQQNTQQTAMQNNQFNQEQTMFNTQNAAKQQDTQSARSAASSLYFGRARNGRGFQGRG